MDEVPYTALMYLNAVIPDYNSEPVKGAPKKAMSLWDIVGELKHGRSV